MSKHKLPVVELRLDSIIGGGQAIGTLDSGKKTLVWGGLPGEKVEVQVTKKKSSLNEGYVTNVIEASAERVEPTDPDSYLSTSPWQIMSAAAEQHYKAALIEEAFELHDIVLPDPIDVYSDGNLYSYRNKVEFSWWWDNETSSLDLAFFRRGSKGKIPVNGTSLARPEINQASIRLRDLLRSKAAEARDLKTVIARSDQQGNVVLQLYVKREDYAVFSNQEIADLNIQGFELIYSNPKSPASVITKRLQSWGEVSLTDTILEVPFRYAVEGFFQINLPVYEQALKDMSQWVPSGKKTVDLYSGVGSIGLTIGGDDVTLVEINQHAVREMNQNIARLNRDGSARAVLAPSEEALEYINSDITVIVDPPRAGLHDKVINRLLETSPARIIYLSCNPVTQARDTALLAEQYGVRHHRGYNFFPRTPHIEHLIVLDKK